MACKVCNPYCGNCRPPRERPRVCPDCGKLHFPEHGFPVRCVRCDVILPERQLPHVARCSRSGLLCGNPCGRRVYVPVDGKLASCGLNTRPVPEQLAEYRRRNRAVRQTSSSFINQPEGGRDRVG